jgi:hypothetical protein
MARTSRWSGPIFGVMGEEGTNPVAEGMIRADVGWGDLDLRHGAAMKNRPDQLRSGSLGRVLAPNGLRRAAGK